MEQHKNYLKYHQAFLVGSPGCHGINVLLNKKQFASPFSTEQAVVFLFEILSLYYPVIYGSHGPVILLVWNHLSLLPNLVGDHLYPAEPTPSNLLLFILNYSVIKGKSSQGLETSPGLTSVTVTVPRVHSCALYWNSSTPKVQLDASSSRIDYSSQPPLQQDVVAWPSCSQWN